MVTKIVHQLTELVEKNHEQDGSAVEETLYLSSVPGMHDSLKKGMETPVEECDEDINW